MADRVAINLGQELALTFERPKIFLYRFCTGCLLLVLLTTLTML